MNKNRKQTPKDYRLWGMGQLRTSSQMVSLEGCRIVAHVIIRDLLESTADIL